MSGENKLPPPQKSTDLPQASAQDVPTVLAHYNVNPAVGLSTQEVNARRNALQYGYNQLIQQNVESAFSKFVEQFKNPLILLLLASAAISFALEQKDDAFSILLAVLIVVTVAFVQEYRSDQAMRKLSTLMPHQCTVIRDDGKVQTTIDAVDLIPGDIIRLNVGDRVPADARLIDSVDLEVDESSLTGESVSVQKSVEAVPETSDSTPVPGLLAAGIELMERDNVVFMGTMVRAGRADAIVINTREYTELGKIFEMVDNAAEKKTPLQASMDTLSKQLTIMSLAIIAVIVFVGSLFQHKDFLSMFQIGVSLAVAAIPEGLPVCVTVTLGLGVLRMAKQNAIVRSLPAVEALGCTNTLCVDKTGTLTQNQMTVVMIYSAGIRDSASVTGVGYSSEGTILMRDVEITKQDVVDAFARVLYVGSICNNAKLFPVEGSNTQFTVVGQPTEAALLIAAKKLRIHNDPRTEGIRTSETSFSSERKWMSVTFKKPDTDQRPITYMKGAIEELLPRCTTRTNAQGLRVQLHPADRDQISMEAEKWGMRGLRIVALATGAEESPSSTMNFEGFVCIMDPPREQVSSCISTLLNAEISVIMITGDSYATAISFASRVGLYQQGLHTAMSGQQLENLSLLELQRHLSVKNTRVFYRTTPKHKQLIVEALQKSDQVVAMTGDGINDAPALKMADIGVAMGKSGTDVSREASDVILVDDNLSTIISAINEGKGIFYNIKSFLAFQLSTSVAALSLVAITTLCGLPSPLNAMQILWINIMMDGPPAQSLGVEPVDPDVIRAKPRKSSDNILDKALLTRIVIKSMITIIATLIVYMSEVRRETDGKWLLSNKGTTSTFTTFVFFNLFNAFSCRSATKSIFKIGFFTNIAFLIAAGLSLAGQLMMIYFPPMQKIFQTEALSARDLFSITLLSSSIWILDEVFKAIQQHRVKKSAK